MYSGMFGYGQGQGAPVPGAGGGRSGGFGPSTSHMAPGGPTISQYMKPAMPAPPPAMAPPQGGGQPGMNYAMGSNDVQSYGQMPAMAPQPQAQPGWQQMASNMMGQFNPMALANRLVGGMPTAMGGGMNGSNIAAYASNPAFQKYVPNLQAFMGNFAPPQFNGGMPMGNIPGMWSSLMNPSLTQIRPNFITPTTPGQVVAY